MSHSERNQPEKNSEAEEMLKTNNEIPIKQQNTTRFQQNSKGKKYKVFSQAYPSIDQRQFETPQHQADLNNSSLNQKSKILKPEVHSQVHQKLQSIHFSIQEHEQPILIRRFRLQDLKELKNLQNEWFPIKYGEAFYKRIIRNQVHCLVAQTVIKVIQKQGSNTQVFTEQNILIGAAVFQLTDSEGYAQKTWFRTIYNIFGQVQDSIYIMTLGVIDQFRKKGVGKMLVNEIIQITKNYQNIKLVYLHVITYNKAAINFYKNIGFRELEFLTGFYHVGGKKYDGEAYGVFVNNGKLNVGWSSWLKKLLR